MAYVLTTPFTIPAGTVFEQASDVPDGGLEALLQPGCMRVFVGRVAALDQGLIAPERKRPALSVVPVS